jgi:hypothetical protein
VTILDITGIDRKENYIYYLREFTAMAHYDVPGRKIDGKIEFVIETTPLGKKDIHVKLLDPIDYPVLPVIQSLKEFIRRLDGEGKLP